MAYGANGAAPGSGALDCSRILSEGLFLLVAVGTAHDALLTCCRATLPGPAMRSTSSELDGRGRFPELGWGKVDQNRAAYQALVLATMTSRHSVIGGSENRYVRLRRTQAFLRGPRTGNAPTLRPVSLCAIRIRRASVSARLGRTPILTSAFPEFAPALSGSLRATKQELRSSWLRCLKPGLPARGRQEPHGSQT